MSKKKDFLIVLQKVIHGNQSNKYLELKECCLFLKKEMIKYYFYIFLDNRGDYRKVFEELYINQTEDHYQQRADQAYVSIKTLYLRRQEMNRLASK